MVQQFVQARTSEKNGETVEYTVRVVESRMKDLKTKREEET